MSNIRTEAVKQYDYDVAVIGSGSGGIAAAVAAARNGCRVLVLEKNGYVGGMTTAGLPYLGYLDVKKRPTVGGLAIEFVERLKQDNASFGVRYCPALAPSQPSTLTRSKLPRPVFWRRTALISAAHQRH